MALQEAGIIECISERKKLVTKIVKKISIFFTLILGKPVLIMCYLAGTAVINKVVSN